MVRPTLSVFLPNYNHARHLPVALEAILAQSWPADEVIVVDDGSTDYSLDVLTQFARRDSRLRVVCNPHNQGVIAAGNRGIDLCQGDYIYGAAADDEVLPGFFETALGMLSQHPQAGLCCGFPSYVEVTGRQGRFVPDDPQWSDRPCYLSPRQMVDRFRRRNKGARVGRSIYSPATICRRASLLAAGKYLPQLHWQADFFANHTIALREGVCYVPRTMSLFFKRAEAYSGRGRQDRQLSQRIGAGLAQLLLSQEYSDVCIPYLAAGLMAPQNPHDPRWAPVLAAVERYLASSAEAATEPLIKSPDSGAPRPHFLNAPAPNAASAFSSVSRPREPS